MKNATICLVVLVLASSFGHAQNAHFNIELSKFKGYGPLGANYEYINDVQNDITPSGVKYLENIASYWDVTTSEKFEGYSVQPFEITFRSTKGSIVAQYDNKGSILSTQEKFNDVALPKEVGVSILKDYPGWDFVKTSYTLYYNRATGTKKNFKVQISRDGEKKWLTIYPSGAII